jgi:hypothetical protein
MIPPPTPPNIIRLPITLDTIALLTCITTHPYVPNVDYTAINLSPKVVKLDTKPFSSPDTECPLFYKRSLKNHQKSVKRFAIAGWLSSAN